MKKISNFLALLMTATILLMGCLGLAACGEPTVTELSVKTPPVKTTYVIGEKFSPKGMRLTAVWSDGTEEDISYAKCDYPTTAFTEVVDKVTVTYENASVDVPVTVYAEIGVESVNVTSEYFVSAVKTTDKLTLKDLNVKAIYNDASMENVDEYTVSIDGTDVTAQVIGEGVEGISLTKGLHRCDITVDGKSYTYYIGAYDETADQIKVEAENYYTTADLSGTEMNFLEVAELSSERNSSNNFKSEDSTAYGASGTGSIAGIVKGDVYKLHVTVAEAGKYNFYTNVATTSRSSNTQFNTNALNDIFKMKVNDVDFAIPVEAMAHGHTVTSGTKYTTADWYYWTLVCLGEVELNAGENVIEIECYEENKIISTSGGTFNIDYFAFQK